MTGEAEPKKHTAKTDSSLRESKIQDPNPIEYDSPNFRELLPQWLAYPHFERVDWLNDFLVSVWPHLDRAGNKVYYFFNKVVDFEITTVGPVPPSIHGIQVSETNYDEFLLEPVVSWAGNPKISLQFKLKWIPFPIKAQILNLQIFAPLRMVLKPIPTFPCASSIVVSFMEKPHVDFTISIWGFDILALPCIYNSVHEVIRQVGLLYLWPGKFQIPIIQEGSLQEVTKPVGILFVKLVTAHIASKNMLSYSTTFNAYVTLSLSGRRSQSHASTKKRSSDPTWLEGFEFVVDDLRTQILHIEVHKKEKHGLSSVGIQELPLKELIPFVTKDVSLHLDKFLLRNIKKCSGKVDLEVTFKGFRGAEERRDDAAGGGGLLLVTILRTHDIVWRLDSFAIIKFKDEPQKQTTEKISEQSWNEEFCFILPSAPVGERLRIEVLSKSMSDMGSLEFLGRVDIDLSSVISRGQDQEKLLSGWFSY